MEGIKAALDRARGKLVRQIAARDATAMEIEVLRDEDGARGAKLQRQEAAIGETQEEIKKLSAYAEKLTKGKK